jgi:hypothetical protein
VSAAGQALWDDAVVRARIRLGEWAERRRVIEAGGDPDAEATDEDTDGEAAEGRIDVTERTAPATGPTSADRAAYAAEQAGRPLWDEVLTQFAVFHADAEHARPWLNTTRLFAAIYGPYTARTPTCGMCEQTEDSSGFYKSCCRAPADGAEPTPLENLWHWPQTTDDWSPCRRPLAGLGSHGFRHRTSEAAPPSPCDFEYATSGQPVDDVRTRYHPRVRLHHAPQLAEPADQGLAPEDGRPPSIPKQLRDFFSLEPAKERPSPPLKNAPASARSPFVEVATHWTAATQAVEQFLTDATGIRTSVGNPEDLLLIAGALPPADSHPGRLLSAWHSARAKNSTRSVTVGSMVDGQPSTLVSSMVAARVMGAPTTDRSNFLFKYLPGHRQFVVMTPKVDTEEAAELAFEDMTAPAAALGFEAAGECRSPELRMDELRFLVQCLVAALIEREGAMERVKSLTLDQQVFAFLGAATGKAGAEASRRPHLQTVYRCLTKRNVTEHTIEFILGQRLLRDAKFVLRRRLTGAWEAAKDDARAKVAGAFQSVLDKASSAVRFLKTWLGSPRLNKDEKKQATGMSDKSKKTI